LNKRYDRKLAENGINQTAGVAPVLVGRILRFPPPSLYVRAKKKQKRKKEESQTVPRNAFIPFI
jgi:hypothetical protein